MSKLEINRSVENSSIDDFRDKIKDWPDDFINKVLKAATEDHVVPEEIRIHNQMADKLCMAEEICFIMGKRISQKQFSIWLDGRLPKAVDKHLHETMDIGIKEAVEMINGMVKQRRDTQYGNIQGDDLIPVRHIPTPNQLACASLNLPCLDPIPAVTPSKDSNIKLFGSCLVHGLRSENLLPSGMNWEQHLKYAQDIARCVIIINYTGTIHSKNSSLRALQTTDATYNFTNLFERKGNYLVGKHSFKYWTTNLTDTIILPTALVYFSTLDFIIVKPEPTDLIIDKERISTLKDGRSLVTLLTNIKGVNQEGQYVIHYSETDRQESRKYNTFTAMGPGTRKHLGYINYDLSAGLQRIVFNELNINQYPAHKMMLQNKTAFREQLSKELDKTISQVKEYLTAADNGQQKSNLHVQSKLFADYYQEGQKIASAYIKIFKVKYPARYKIACKYADMDKIHSIFFFCWTQIERDIREVMVNCFKNTDDVREVHDAVYSKELLDCSYLETKVKQKLNLDIVIEH